MNHSEKEVRTEQAIFGERLKSCLKSCGMSQSDLANRLYTNRSNISRYCSGTHLPEIHDICKIADILSVSIDYLLGKTDIQSSDITVRTISEYTGLRESTITDLHFISNHDKADDEKMDLLNMMIGEELLFTLSEYFSEVNSVNGELNQLLALSSLKDSEEFIEEYKKIFDIVTYDQITAKDSSFISYCSEYDFYHNLLMNRLDFVSERLESKEYRLKKQLDHWVQNICHTEETLKKVEQVLQDYEQSFSEKYEVNTDLLSVQNVGEDYAESKNS